MNTGNHELAVSVHPEQLLTIEPAKYVELVFEPFSKQLAEAKAAAAAIDELDVTTTSGMALAIRHRATFRDIRVSSEKARKERKAPILEIGRLLDRRQRQLETEIEPFESHFDKAIKAEEARKETERQAKINEEVRRTTKLQERVAELRGNQMLSATSDPELIASHIADLEAIPVDESFQEFQQQAADAKGAGLARLRELHAAALAHEAEQKRIQAEREELARLKAEQAQREADERARKAEEDRRAQEQRDREAAEQRRVSALRDRLADLRSQGTIPGDWPSSKIEARIRLVEGLSPGGAVWQEFAQDADTARTDVLASLRSLHDAALRREAEEKRLRDQQAELDRQRREQEQRQAEIDRREREQREAEDKRRREAAEAEERRIADERAEQQRKDREAAEKRAREERRQKALENPPPAMDIVKTVAEGYGVDLDVAMDWLTTLDFSDMSESEAA